MAIYNFYTWRIKHCFKSTLNNGDVFDKINAFEFNEIKKKIQTDKNLEANNEIQIKKFDVEDQSKTVNQIKNIVQEEKITPEIQTEIKSDGKLSIKSLNELIDVCSKKKELKLKYELEKNVNLVKFEKNLIEISFNESLDKDFVKDLSYKLFEWTNERWIISFSQLKGEMSVKSKKNNIKKLLIDKAKESEIYHNVLQNFPDAELVDVKSKDNEGDEEKNNDWFHKNYRQSKGIRGKNEGEPRKN